MSKINVRLGRRLRKARKTMNYTQIDLAAAVGVTWTTIGNYERAVTPLPVPVLLAACRVLNRNPVEMLEGLW